MSRTTKRFRSLVITVVAIAVANIAVAYASGSASTKESTVGTKKSGLVVRLGDCPRPKSGLVVRLGDCPRP